MEIVRRDKIRYINIIENLLSGRLDAVIFQQNQIIRIDKQMMVKYKAKKLEKDK